MEVPNGTELDRTILPDNAVTYNILDEDVEPILKETHRPLSYENVLVNDVEVSSNNFEPSEEQQGKANLTAVEINIPQIYERDEKWYDSVPLEESTSTETTSHDETGLKSTTQNDVSNEIKDSGQTSDLGENTEFFIYEHNRGADVTYTVVDPIDSVTTENDRQRQIADLESYDTYATINKITTK